jgi:hypothetical protein
MSSPATTVGNVASDFANALLGIFDALAQALQTYAPILVEVAITVGLVSGLGYALSRIPMVRRFLGWIGL